MDRNAAYDFAIDLERPLTVGITTETKCGTVQWSVNMDACKHVLLGSGQREISFQLRWDKNNWKCVGVHPTPSENRSAD